MSQEPPVENLEQLFDQIREAAEKAGDRVSLDTILERVGRRSFGALLLVAGLITLAPLLGDIPGVPTIVGGFVVLITGQLLFGREYFWLPRWLLERFVAKGQLCKALERLRPVARFVDRWLQPRLRPFTHASGMYAIALVCFVIAAAMPVMEFIPFSANGAGMAFTVFGLSLIARDGLLVLLGFGLTAITFALGVLSLL